MTHVTVTEPTTKQVSRPRPGPRPDRGAGPGLRVAPPVVDAFGPWVAVLEQSGAPGELRWVVGPDGVLLPTHGTGNAAGVRSKGRAVRDRLAAFVRH
jgi:hypothetical protein